MLETYTITREGTPFPTHPQVSSIPPWLWWLVSLLLTGYVTASAGFGATYGPLTAVMALLLWANLTAVALLLGIAFAAQLEARRIGLGGPAVSERWTPAAEQPNSMLGRRN